MKTRRVLLILFLAAVLLAAFAMSRSEARTTTASIVLSGGQYVLTIQSPPATQTAGYRTVDADTADDEGSGCCCKGYLPCVLRSE
jgi:hypothetical protein